MARPYRRRHRRRRRRSDYRYTGRQPNEVLEPSMQALTHMKKKHTAAGVEGVENMERHKRNSIFNTGQRPATQT